MRGKLLDGNCEGRCERVEIYEGVADPYKDQPAEGPKGGRKCQLNQ